MSNIIQNDIINIGKMVIQLYWYQTIYLRVPLGREYYYSTIHTNIPITFNNIKQKLIIQLDELREKIKQMDIFSCGYIYKTTCESSLYKLYILHKFPPEWKRRHNLTHYATNIIDFGVPVISVFLGSIYPYNIKWDKGKINTLLNKIKSNKIPKWLLLAIQPIITETSL